MHFPAGRGGGVATDVRRHPVADRPAPGTTHASMTGARQICDRRERWRRCALVQANQRVYRLAAVGRLLLTNCCGRDARFTVVETPQKGDPSSQPFGIGGMSVK